MKHGSLTCRIALSALLLASLEPANAGLFGVIKNNVVVKVAELRNPDSEIYPLGLEFTIDGSHIAVESQSGKIHIWDWRAKRIEKTIEMPKGFGKGTSNNPIRISRDGRLLAACDGRAGEIVARIWNTDTWLTAKDITDAGIGGCEGIEFTPDGKSLACVIDRVGDPGNSLVVYVVGTWQPIWGLPIANYAPVSIAISPDGGIAALDGTLTTVPENARDPNASLDLLKRDPTIYLVNLKQRRIQRVIQNSDRGPMAWSPDGARLAVVGGPHVEIFDARSGQNLVREKVEKAGNMNVRFTADGRYFIDSDLNGMGKGLGVKIWDGQHQKMLQHISAGDVGSIAVSRDGKFLAVGSTGRTTIWHFK
jgi:WD40 repeat protein